MIRLARRLLLSLLIVFSNTTFAKTEAIPQVLQDWVPWVQKDLEHIGCPAINQSPYGQRNSHICAWPSSLRLDATNQGAQFNQNWQVLEESWLPLPGNRENWPQQVSANGQAVTVIEHRGLPALRLKKGNYDIRGIFNWSRLPETLAVPPDYAFVEMTVNNQTIAFPRLEKGELWLSELQVNPSVNDSVDLEVYRLVSDSAYINLTTEINLEVSGKRREQALGKVLPPGFSLISVKGDLSAYLDAQGILHAKLKPGSWTLEVEAYAKPNLTEWQHPGVTGLWPRQEIWVFYSDEHYRVGKIRGGSIIDSAQLNVPTSWEDYPAYLLNQGESLTYNVSKRGRSDQLENRLELKRDLWLDFDGNQFTFVDQVTGKMVDNWRMSMKAPFTLGSAEDEDGPMLITKTADNAQGIENRYYDTDLKAVGTLKSQGEMPVSGWDSHFEKVLTTLNLPPSYRLFAVFGADSSSGSWLSKWTIWNVFIVLLSAILVARLTSVATGLVTAVTLILIYHEHYSPVLLLLNLVLAMMATKHLKFDWLNNILRSYLGISLLAFAANALYFSAEQLRTTVYPQLERQSHHVMYKSKANIDNFSRNKRAEINLEDAEYASEMVERIEVKGSAVSQSDYLPQRYQSDALMQAGPGIPDWSWNKYQIQWTSPVAKDQQVNIVIQPAWLTRILKVLGVVLILLWTALLFSRQLKSALLNPVTKPAAAALIGLLLLPVGSENAYAEAIPDEDMLRQLQQRVIEAPVCSPQCATIGQITVSAANDSLSMEMTVHVLEETAISLPESNLWRPQTVIVDGKQQHTLYRRKGWTYIALSPGIKHLTVSGKLAPVEQLQIQFKDKPKQVTVNPSTHWEVIGVNQNRLNANTLEFIAKQQQNDSERQNSRYTVKPYVEVSRVVKFEMIWKVTTTVSRIAPSTGAITMKIPLLPTERVLTDNMTVQDNHVEITLASNSDFDEISWSSTLQTAPELTLTANESLSATEHWKIISSPIWHVKHSQLPIVAEQGGDYASANYYPYPGESLTLNISRPKAIAGQLLAFDRVKSVLKQGERNATYELELHLRATRGGEHSISIPDGYQLKEVLSDDKTLNLEVENGELTLPVMPGEDVYKLIFRTSNPPAFKLMTPQIDLRASASNIETTVELTQTRWILWADGPVVGPAVVYWGELLIFLLLAFLLSRYPFSPLKTTAWLLLGFGLSLYSWWVLMGMVVWFGSITLAKHRPKSLSCRQYNLSQAALYMLTLVTLYHLVLSIPGSLLGYPDMGITGNYKMWEAGLSWFIDRSEGPLPIVSLINVPILIYKGIMLLWVLWLCFSLIKWCKWAWQGLGEQGYWHKCEPKLPAKDNDSQNDDDNPWQDDARDSKPKA